jgi:hypothetical protein
VCISLLQLSGGTRFVGKGKGKFFFLYQPLAVLEKMLITTHVQAFVLFLKGATTSSKRMRVYFPDPLALHQMSIVDFGWVG